MEHKYTHINLARIVIEAKSPLTIGCGEKDFTTDSIVATDVNGLPYIPGASIAGVVRSLLGYERCNDSFGYQDRNQGLGSRVIFTEAKILNSKGEVVDGLRDPKEIIKDPLLRHYRQLPVRQHVRLGSSGTSEHHGKFDEQIVFVGTRFCFEIEMLSTKEDKHEFDEICNIFKEKMFRIGGGTRKGFGEISVCSLRTRSICLKNEYELYLSKPSELNKSENWQGWQSSSKDEKNSHTLAEEQVGKWIRYELVLEPEDFFLFSSGLGDEEADITPVKASKVVWDIDEKGCLFGRLENDLVLIPATSIKGAIAHRVAYYYNMKKHRYIGSTGEKKPLVGDENEAVRTLFGGINPMQRGKLLFSDLILDTDKGKGISETAISHVSIDRFTGGAKSGALFQEKVLNGSGMSFHLAIWAPCEALADKDIRDSLKSALEDICCGMLPLGGGVNRGHGVFKGKLIEKKNDK